jgi:CheY-like chemotaxis protein
MKYVGFMKMLSWIATNSEDDGDYIRITEMGRELIPVLSDYMRGKFTDTFRHYNTNIVGVQGDVGGEPGRWVKPIANSNANAISSNARKRHESSSVEDSLRHPSSQANDSDSEDASERQDRKILLIDDEPDALLTYKSFLGAEGHSVDAFEDPEKAFIRFASMKPGYYDLVITDIRMRQLNGIKLYQRIKALDPGAKVIFVTALDAAEELVTILSPQPATILRKPIEQRVFNDCVRSLLA